MIFIAMGSNLSFGSLQPSDILHSALKRLISCYPVHIFDISPFITTVSWPDSTAPAYTNGVVSVGTSLSPHALLHALLAIEQHFGRVRTVKNAPRTLDLDLIAYHDYCCDTSRLILPHPRCHRRRFVLEPLLSLKPAWIHPRLHRAGRLLLRSLV